MPAFVFALSKSYGVTWDGRVQIINGFRRSIA